MPSLEAFPILPITDDMIVQDEPMGSKDKFWCQLPDNAANDQTAVMHSCKHVAIRSTRHAQRPNRLAG